MHFGAYGEILGTTGTLDKLDPNAVNFRSKVVAPRNPKLIKDEEHNAQKLTPSKYLFDVCLTTEQKLAITHKMRVPKKFELLDMQETTDQKVCYVSIDKPLFQPFPSEIFFQQFQAYKTYEVPLVLRNNDKVPRLVKLQQSDSPYFKIISPTDFGSKVGPGLQTTFKVQFTPDENKDYNHEIICITEREKYIVPIKAVGARPILDFPDEIFFPLSPVNFTISKTLLVRNIGNMEAKFSLSTTEPFSVTTTCGNLALNETIQVIVEFNPRKIGNHSDYLVLHYSTGEDIYINLYAAAQDINVRLDKNSIRIENTFITQSTQRTVNIHNRTDVIVKFKWCQHASQEDEYQEKRRCMNKLDDEKKDEELKFSAKVICDATLREKLAILSRSFENRKMYLKNDKAFFNDDAVKIEPSEGEIWPNSSMAINIIFKPSQAVCYIRTAFCEVTGRESRLPLRIRGEGMGPKVQFSFETLDMGSIFIGSSHFYEVVLANKGNIDANFTILSNKSNFGQSFSFLPTVGSVLPSGHQSIQIMVTGSQLGDFQETFKVKVAGLPEDLKLTFRGAIIGPTFYFDVPQLHFGTVSYGFFYSSKCVLHNTSLVSMKFHLHVPGDGIVDSILSTNEALDNADNVLPPKEFTILPDSGTIKPQSSVEIQVNFVSNTVKKYETNLVVDVINVGNQMLSLPIVARCVVPSVCVVTSTLNMGRCFIQHPYSQVVQLKNLTNLPARYQFLPEDNPGVLIQSLQPAGIIHPEKDCKIPLVVNVQSVQQEFTSAVFFRIFGSHDLLKVKVVCIGEGPVVHISHLEFDWGIIPVLTDSSKSLTLQNESVIPAKFTTSLVRLMSVFKVEPHEGEIAPLQSTVLTITANLNDTAKFKDRVQVNILQSSTHHVNVTAQGYGSLIVSNPPLTPELYLGPHFSNQLFSKKFVITNKGRRHQQLMWASSSLLLSRTKFQMKEKLSIRNLRAMSTLLSSGDSNSVLHFKPSRFELAPGESNDIYLEGYVARPRVVSETLLCFAIIGRQGGKELIMHINATVNFITPLLNFSSKNILFRVDKKPEDTLDIQSQHFHLTNISSLPLTIQFNLVYPFQIRFSDGYLTTEAIVNSGVGMTISMEILFDPAYKEDRCTCFIDEVLKVSYLEHPHIDFITLRGEVYFPNLMFEKMFVDFGCILNDTEVTRYVNITNNSPMAVKYNWSFLVNSSNTDIYRRAAPLPIKEAVSEVDELSENALSEDAELLLVSLSEEKTDPMSKEKLLGNDSVIQQEFQPNNIMMEITAPSPEIQNSDSNNRIEEKIKEEYDSKNEWSLIGSHDLEPPPEKGQLEQEDSPEVGVDKNETEGLKEASRVSSKRITHSGLTLNKNLAAVLGDTSSTRSPLTVEEVFDILPLYGTLQPAETEQITLTFYGHEHICAQAKAACSVLGGPTYELMMKGEASLVDYHFDCMTIDFGKRMYNEVAEAEITLMNTGLVGFEFTVLNCEESLPVNMEPQVLAVFPNSGYISAQEKQTLAIKYYIGVPEQFESSFRILVAHFDPELIHFFGEALFPRISLDLPRYVDDEYSVLLAETKENIRRGIYKSRKHKQHKTSIFSKLFPSNESEQRKSNQSELVASALDLEMEVERLAVCNFLLGPQLQQTEACSPNCASTISNYSYKNVSSRSLSSKPMSTSESSLDAEMKPSLSTFPSSPSSKLSKKTNKNIAQRVKVPDYILDFGYVVLGTVRTHVVNATNIGWFPVSLHVDQKEINQYGFHTELNRVRNLPGAPDHESFDFVVNFDPRGANLELGPVETIASLNIVHGPQVNIRLQAIVTMPDMEISKDILDFSEVKCGNCKVITIQLHNHKKVCCEWSYSAEKEKKKPFDKFLPMYMRQKPKPEPPKPKTFEVLPPSGVLIPHQHLNIQVKFMPTEQKFYEQRLVIKIAQSSQRIVILCHGQGLEPQLEFDRTLVEFGPVLPHSAGDEQEIIVTNPCSFPIEMYNLECDLEYLEEEKILRLMKGYDEFNLLLLPPRSPGQKLPPELSDYYEERKRKLEETETLQEEIQISEVKPEKNVKVDVLKAKQETEEDKMNSIMDGEPLPTEVGEVTDEQMKDEMSAPDVQPCNTEKSPEEEEEELDEEEKLKRDIRSGTIMFGDLQITPASAAIAQYLGIDLTPAGRAALSRRGVAMVVHGPSQSGRTTTAIQLAKHYGAALLTIDSVVEDTIANGNTPAGMRAKCLCIEAARKKYEDMRIEEESKKLAGTLSIDAVAAHSQNLANRKPSSVLEPRGKHQSNVGKGSSDISGSMIPSSQSFMQGPIPKTLSKSASIAGEEGLMSTVLPEEMLVEILSDRLQLNDCNKGVVIDSLDTVFSQNLVTAAQAVLKAFNNRRYIYFITLKLDLNSLKEREKQEAERKEHQDLITENQEKKWLEEMSEEEYDKLNEEQKAAVDKKRLLIKKKRIKREKEQKEKERQREEEERETHRKLEEDRLKKRGRKHLEAKRGSAAAKSGSIDKTLKIHMTPRHSSVLERPESRNTEKSDQHVDEKKKKLSKDRRLGSDQLQNIKETEIISKDPTHTDSEAKYKKFRAFEHTLKDICDLLDQWDRTIMQQVKRLLSPSETDDDTHPHSAKKGRKNLKSISVLNLDKIDRHKDKEAEKERLAREAAHVVNAKDDSKDVTSGNNSGISTNIPHFIVDCLDTSTTFADQVLQNFKLPTAVEVLNGLGLGPSGPPIPPDTTFSVVPYPVKRKSPPLGELATHFTFLVPTDFEQKAFEGLDLEAEEKMHLISEVVQGETKPGTSKAKLKDRRSADKKRSVPRQSTLSSTLDVNFSVSEDIFSVNEGTAFSETKNEKLMYFRWIIPAESQVVLKLCFQSDELGQFDQTLNFEISGTRRRYQVFCRGVCTFPTISREPRIVFPKRKKTKKVDEIVYKRFILHTEIFEFGPLLVGKTRENYKEGKYPENMECFNIMNVTSVEAEVSFCFLNDAKMETFILEPLNMILNSQESQPLTVWAYPRNPGRFTDCVVCCVKENPEPILFKIACDAFRPELELDKRIINFEKVLLHRKEMKTVYLRNRTHLPVFWRLNGMDNLGEDFTVVSDSGLVQPLNEYALSFYFRAMKPSPTTKKSIRLEIADAENIVGVVLVEPLQIIYEAFDVALDMSFPKGSEGGLDFGNVRIGEEAKLICYLKNKGKYEIAYNLIFKDQNPKMKFAHLFSLNPNKGSLGPLDRPVQVQVFFQSKTEVVIKDLPILRCLVIEPTVGQGGEVIANIPVNISARSAYSKFSVSPAFDLNFGCLILNSKKTRSFVIENKGVFDFRYSIIRLCKDARKSDENTVQSIKFNQATLSIRSKFTGRQEASSTVARLVAGVFTIHPALGTVAAGGHHTVNVECTSETMGHFVEELEIDINDRNPKDHPRGVFYHLLAESCIPLIQTENVSSIFEEHRICKSLSMWQHYNQLNSGGVYGIDERKFSFGSVIVGQNSKARFRITNKSKVPCDVVFTLKQPVFGGKSKHHQPEVFEVSPTRAQIPNHGHMYVTITFIPQIMQVYNISFEAAIETSSAQLRGKSLQFDVCGEGTLPRVSVYKPQIYNTQGQPVLLFKQNLVGNFELLPLVLTNDGCQPCKVNIDLIDPDKVFSLQPVGETHAVMGSIVVNGKVIRKRPHTASVSIDIGESAAFEVTFKPTAAQRSQGQIQLSIVDNQYEDSVVQIIGEGYEDEITLDNIHSITDVIEEPVSSEPVTDDVPAGKPNLITFGRCYIKESRTLTFTMTNRSQKDSMRFKWQKHEILKFSPRIGHLHPGAAKEFTITFKANSPFYLQETAMVCNINKITFNMPLNEVLDWDNRLQVVKWVAIDTFSKPVQESDSRISLNQPVSYPSPQPGKRKVTETEPEPAHERVGKRKIELLVTALADFCKYSCDVDIINFKDTFMFQNRLYKFTVENVGNVPLDYHWQIVMDNYTSLQHTATFLTEGEQSESRERDTTEDYLPFSFSPECGTINPGKTGTFTLQFSPLDINEYTGSLLCSMQNLEPKVHGPIIGLKAKSLLPYCHFDVEDNDYIKSCRRIPGLPGPGGVAPGTQLDPNTKVIEIECVGVGVTITRKFSVLNPTKETFEFEWISEDEPDPRSFFGFFCLTKKASVDKGKQYEIVFEFVSQEIGIVESFWKCIIPLHNISIPFLLVANVREPDLLFSKSHLMFKPRLIGHLAVDSVFLINNEETPFDFSICEDSCHASGMPSSLTVEPLSGTIQPKSRLPIQLNFTPFCGTVINFNIECKVKNKPQLLMLNLKGEGYTMSCLLACENSFGNPVELSSNGLNEIDLGQVELNEMVSRTLTLKNLGKFNFDFKWTMNDQAVHKSKMMSLTPVTGGVKYGKTEQFTLTFQPPVKTSLSGCVLSLIISNGPTYNISLLGFGMTPGLHFSFLSYNFGTCFIHRAGMPIQTTQLKLSNNSEKSISVDTHYTSTNQLVHDFQPQVIHAGKSVIVNFKFYPREAIKYHEEVTFEINALSTQIVHIYGHGAEMKVEVTEHKYKVVKLGACLVNNIVKKTLPIINRSAAAITFNLTYNSNNELLHENLRITPASKITLNPKGGTCKVEIEYAPKFRQSPFSEEVMLEGSGVFQPLFVIQGSCVGMEISLESNYIAFGVVVLKSQSTRKLVVTNTGDMNARLCWDAEKFKPDFTISPVDCHLTTGKEVIFDIVFHPHAIKNEIRYENLCCFINEGDYKPTTLTLTGSCADILPSKEVLTFSTYVRHKDVKQLTIANKTNQLWNLRPIIDGEQWSGPLKFTVEPQHTGQYELTYKPLAMTLDGKKQTGSIFFPLPDGTGLLYHLLGTAEPPKPSGKIQRDIPCKTSYTELLSVHNWLKKPQRFKVKFEYLRQDKADLTTTLKGMEYIDVPANVKKNYPLQFYAYREGLIQMKIIFINELSGEYQFYEATFRATKPGVYGTIDLATEIRRSIPCTVKLNNHLATPVNFTTQSNISEILIPSQVSVPPHSEGHITFEYQPLKVGEYQGRIELNSNELGLYIYEINLKAIAKGPEKPTYFRVSLGQSQTLTIKFLNFAKQKTDYLSKIENTDFHVEKAVPAAPGSTSGTEISVDVTFEPSQLGEHHATLIQSSPVGGEYIFPLFGTCTPPKPMGPHVVKAGTTVPIAFRNIFTKPTSFMFQVDNPLFNVPKQEDIIRNHKDYRIMVGFDGNSVSYADVMGKLIISCPHLSANSTNVQWIHYLKGVTPKF